MNTISPTTKRGMIFLFNFGTNCGSIQGGLRPAVILQCTKQNTSSPTTIIAPLTTELKKTDMTAHILLGKRFGLRRASMILLEQMRTVNQNDLGQYIGTIDDEEIIRRINHGLCMTLGIHCVSTCNTSNKEVSA